MKLKHLWKAAGLVALSAILILTLCLAGLLALVLRSAQITQFWNAPLTKLSQSLVLEEGRDADNLATAARCIAMVQAPPEGVTTEMTATAKKLMDEQIVPKFQLLLAGETTAKDAYDHICEAAFAAFGEENCITGKLG